MSKLSKNCLSVFCPASSGSDSPDQALEAEEIVKQLEIEQTVETPTSTATSTQELCTTPNFYSSVAQLPPLRPPHIPEVSPTAEVGELDADPDLPPLTGKKRNVALKCFEFYVLLCFVPVSHSGLINTLLLWWRQLQAPVQIWLMWTLLLLQYHQRHPMRKTGKSLTRE